jgi:hypothetical protein
MKLHINYSQTNCLLECSLTFAQEAHSNKTGFPQCTPWYFPFITNGHKICDPWETRKLIELISKQVHTLKYFQLFKTRIKTKMSKSQILPFSSRFHKRLVIIVYLIATG